jgi:hypothetical protein
VFEAVSSSVAHRLSDAFGFRFHVLAASCSTRCKSDPDWTCSDVVIGSSRASVVTVPVVGESSGVVDWLSSRRDAQPANDARRVVVAASVVRRETLGVEEGLIRSR